MKSYLKIENAIIKKFSVESLSFGDLSVAPDEFALARFFSTRHSSWSYTI